MSDTVLLEPRTLSGRPTIAELAAVTPARPQVNRGVAGVMWLLLITALVLAGLAYTRRGSEGTDVRAMQAGECFTPTATVDDGGRAIPYGRPAPCMEGSPRVVAILALPLGIFPGTAAIDTAVAERCGGEQTEVIAPTEESWHRGDRTIACLAV